MSETDSGRIPDATTVRWKGLRWLLRQTERCFAGVGLAFVVYCICLDYSRVISGSMRPTLCGTCWRDGDRVLSEKVTYWFRTPRRWEVITFRKQDGTRIMKRVIGLPGETVQMRDSGQILIDGKELPVPPRLAFLDYFPYGNLTSDQPPFECGRGYYVLGDFTRDSDDSRFDGAIPPEEILGRTWLILGPASRRGFVR